MSFLPPRLRPILFAFVTATAPGCTHFANISEVPTNDGTTTYVSSRSWDDGTPRTIITERVFERPEAACDLLRVQREFFDETGVLQIRETDVETCGLVLSRITEEYDIGAARVTRVTQRDSNQDGMFDVERIAQESVSTDQLATLVSAAGSR